MKKLLLILIFLFPLVAQCACRIDGDGKKSDAITLDVTFDLSNNLLSVSQNQVLGFTQNFSCVLSNEKMYFTDNVGDNIYSLGVSNGVKFSIKGISTNFPVSVERGDNSVNVINKLITLQFDYIKNGKAPVKTFGDNTFTIDKAFTIASQSCIRLFGGCLWGSDASQYNVNLNVTVINKKTTCEFLSPHYFIKMEDVTTQELLVGNGKRSKSEDIKLRCDGIHGIASNPVTVKISDGDWDANGQILLNTISTGSKNVGFKLFRGSESVTLHKGNVLLSVAKYSGLETDYVFPVSAEYALTGGGKPTTGEISSKVIFRVDYQ